jgi:lipopolysaccharide transport system ATP-binding protein
MKSGAAKPVVEAYMRANIEAAQRFELAEAPQRAAPAPEAAPRTTGEQPVGAAAGNDDASSNDERTAPAGAGGAVIDQVTVLDGDGSPMSTARGGDIVTLRLRVRAVEDVSSAIVGFHLKDRLGQVLFGENTWRATEGRPVSLAPGETAIAEFRFTMPELRSGKYALDVAVAEGTRDLHVQHQWSFDAAIIQVLTEVPVSGLFSVPYQSISMTRSQPQVRAGRDE